MARLDGILLNQPGGTGLRKMIWSLARELGLPVMIGESFRGAIRSRLAGDA